MPWTNNKDEIPKTVPLDNSYLCVSVYECVCVHTYGLLKGKQNSLVLVQEVSGSVSHPLESC